MRKHFGFTIIISFFLAVYLCEVSASAQNSIAIALNRCEFTPIPHKFNMFKHDWSSANYGIAYKDISFPEYSNVQCTEAFDNSKWQLASTLTAKYQIQPNNGDLLCFFTSDDAETVSGALAIVDSDGKVYDQIDAYVDGAILIRQFTVNSVNSCSVYTFVPDSKESIDIISLWTHKDMKIPGKIRRDDYVIMNRKFDLTETSYTGKITMSCAIHIREQKPLWEY